MIRTTYVVVFVCSCSLFQSRCAFRRASIGGLEDWCTAFLYKFGSGCFCGSGWFGLELGLGLRLGLGLGLGFRLVLGIGIRILIRIRDWN